MRGFLGNQARNRQGGGGGGNKGGGRRGGGDGNREFLVHATTDRPGFPA